MENPFAFALAVLALLATPGPTNTLLAASGASVGPWRSLRLIPAELCGYLISIATLIFVIGREIEHNALAAATLKIAAGLWLAASAAALWRNAGQSVRPTQAPATPTRVFVTTLLNPKALIFAFVIIPPAPAALSLWLAGFSALVILVGGIWIVLGAFLARSTGGALTPALIARGAALILLIFASTLAGSAIAAIL
ncbi:conserved hypothetical protein [Methylocella silvestris BL2]|uniref:Threonine transporter RhtB n=1 Tax=Methylocella silvestris (strain DSM 15510 / CIP 108128 / LMG 27833 / NCIMB 13906 / BL2) TaxID=395965 RepID=B8EQJ9_METSB|nr:hypothetical protein [Methylocella silvestris]ACK52212.1 conserved hypothetical protein [Methylocella silvestris BL2]